MRRSSALLSVGIALTAASGLCCVAPPAPVEGAGVSAPEIVEAEVPRARPPPSLASSAEPFTPATRLARADTIVTSTFEAKDGAIYEAGTFAGAVLLDGERLQSKGGDDVFLVKWNADGSRAWVRAVGSQAHESAPRVGDVEDGRVKLIGMTQGEMDCGSGPLPTWTSQTFFFCVFDSDDGAWLAGGTFPTGAP
jgi:hypothetical protein